jgi:hypothetical protein
LTNETCKVCGQPLDSHFVVLRQGLAHTAVKQDTYTRYCSDEEAERQHLLGRIEALLTIVRSLRQRAGRLRNRGRVWTPEDIEVYIDKLIGDRERLIGYEQRYYAQPDRAIEGRS